MICRTSAVSAGRCFLVAAGRLPVIATRSSAAPTAETGTSFSPPARTRGSASMTPGAGPSYLATVIFCFLNNLSAIVRATVSALAQSWTFMQIHAANSLNIHRCCGSSQGFAVMDPGSDPDPAYCINLNRWCWCWQCLFVPCVAVFVRSTGELAFEIQVVHSNRSDPDPSPVHKHCCGSLWIRIRNIDWNQTKHCLSLK